MLITTKSITIYCSNIKYVISILTDEYRKCMVYVYHLVWTFLKNKKSLLVLHLCVYPTADFPYSNIVYINIFYYTNRLALINCILSHLLDNIYNAIQYTCKYYTRNMYGVLSMGCSSIVSLYH